MPPVTLAYWRWTGAFVIAVGFARPRREPTCPCCCGTEDDAVAVRDRDRLLQHALLHRTDQHHGAERPAAAVGDSAHHHRLGLSAIPRRAVVAPTAGVLFSLCGVAVIAAQGSWQLMSGLKLNPGDLWVIVALVIYGIYCVVLRRRPAVHPLSFLVAAMAIGSA